MRPLCKLSFFISSQTGIIRKSEILQVKAFNTLLLRHTVKMLVFVMLLLMFQQVLDWMLSFFCLGVLDEKCHIQEPCCSDLFLFPDESGNVSQEPGPTYASFTPHLVSDAVPGAPIEHDDFCILFAPRATVQVINWQHNWSFRTALTNRSKAQESSLGFNFLLFGITLFCNLLLMLCKCLLRFTIFMTPLSRTQRRMLYIYKISFIVNWTTDVMCSKAGESQGRKGCCTELLVQYLGEARCALCEGWWLVDRVSILESAHI